MGKFIKSIKMPLILLIMASFYTCILPLYAQSGNELCLDKCKSSEYDSGRISSDGSGTCDENEDVIEAICCCSPKR